MLLGEASLVDYLQAIALLFIAVDPIGNAPLFYAVTSELPLKTRRTIVRKGIYVAFIILVSFAVIGDMVLYHFGLTLADFRIAGGIVLFLYGIMGILGQSEATMLGKPEEVESIAIVPLATPLLAGPASIATVLYLKATGSLALALISILINTVITYAMLANSDKLMDKMGKSGSIALTKIMSMILTVIAISMIRGGIEEAVANLKNHLS